MSIVALGEKLMNKIRSFCYFKSIFLSSPSSLSMGATQLKFQTLLGTPTNPGCCAVSLRTTYCKSGRWWVPWQQYGSLPVMWPGCEMWLVSMGQMYIDLLHTTA